MDDSLVYDKDFLCSNACNSVPNLDGIAEQRSDLFPVHVFSNNDEIYREIEGHSSHQCNRV